MLTLSPRPWVAYRWYFDGRMVPGPAAENVVIGRFHVVMHRLLYARRLELGIKGSPIREQAHFLKFLRSFRRRSHVAENCKH